jgi:hypothetical protein
MERPGEHVKKESRRFMDAGRHPHCGAALIPAGNDYKNTVETRIIEKKRQEMGRGIGHPAGQHPSRSVCVRYHIPILQA